MADEVKKPESSDSPVTYNKKAQLVAILLLGLLAIGMVVESVSKVRKQQAAEQAASHQKNEHVPPSALTQSQESVQSFKEAQDKAKLELDQANKKKLAEKQHDETLNSLADRTTTQQVAGSTPDPNNPNKVVTVQDIYHEFDLRETERVLKARSNDIARKSDDGDQGAYVKTAVAGNSVPSAAKPGSAMTSGTDINGINALIEQNRKTIADIKSNSERVMTLAQQKDPAMFAAMTAQNPSPAITPTPASGEVALTAVAGQQPVTVSSPFFGETNSNREFTSRTTGPKPGESTIVTSTTLSAVLQQDVISDFPNTWIAVLQRPVYDVAQENILLPTGTRIMGKTMRGSEVNEVIQNRLGMPAFKIIRPDGKVINLQNAQGLDSSGLAGVADEVDRHWLAQLFGVAAYALVGIAPSQSNFGSQPL